jgi:hypothetical protein
MELGALCWDPNAPSADGHAGAFSIALDAMPAAATELMGRVMRIKATGDRAAAEALAARFVGADPSADLGATPIPHAVVAERWAGSFPQTSFVYEVLE